VFVDPVTGYYEITRYDDIRAIANVAEISEMPTDVASALAGRLPDVAI
jgi:hypothetical protein